MKGIFELNPALLRYKSMWDVGIVFKYFRCQSHASTLKLKDLTLKVAFLLALLTGQRCQTLHLLCIDSMTIQENQYTFYVTDAVKETRQKLYPVVHL